MSAYTPKYRNNIIAVAFLMFAMLAFLGVLEYRELHGHGRGVTRSTNGNLTVYMNYDESATVIGRLTHSKESFVTLLPWGKHAKESSRNVARIYISENAQIAGKSIEKGDYQLILAQKEAGYFALFYKNQGDGSHYGSISLKVFLPIKPYETAVRKAITMSHFGNSGVKVTLQMQEGYLEIPIDALN